MFRSHFFQVEQEYSGVDIELVERHAYLGFVIDVLNPQVGYPGTNVIGYVGLPQLFERTVYHQVAVEIECFVELGEPFGNGIAVVGLQGDIPDVEIEVAEVGIVDNVEMYLVMAVSLCERREFLPVFGVDVVR